MKKIAEKFCANYGKRPRHGKCDAVMIAPNLMQYIDGDYYDKPCCVDEKRCEYFERSVMGMMEWYHKYTQTTDYWTLRRGWIAYEKDVLEKLLARCTQCKRSKAGFEKEEIICDVCLDKNKRNSLKRTRTAKNDT